MEKLIKKEGVYYTQVATDIPIEERVFFSQGLVANINDYRIATEEEIETWHEYQAKQEEEMKLMDTDNEQPM